MQAARIKHLILIKLLFIAFYTNAQVTDSISYRLIINEDNKFTFVIKNYSKDTLYLFDTYLINEKLTTNKYFYRYNKKSNTCVVSFLPMTPYLATSITNLDTTLKENVDVVTHGAYSYHFKKISPNDSVFFNIRYMRHKDGVYKIANMRKYTNSNKEIKFKKTMLPWSNYVNFEFAIYKDITIFLLGKENLCNKIKFDKQALSYDVLTIPCGREGAIH